MMLSCLCFLLLLGAVRIQASRVRMEGYLNQLSDVAVKSSDVTNRMEAELRDRINSNSQSSEASTIGPGDPDVVFWAVKCVWMRIHGGSCGSGIDYSKDRFYLPANSAIGLSKDKCKVRPHIDVNKELQPIREQWKEERKGTSFMSKDTPAEQADELVKMLSGSVKVTQGSKSGSDIFMTSTKDLFLKSEGMSELNVFTKPRKKGSTDTFVKDYAKRILGTDTETDKLKCHRSTMQRFLLVFTVACRGDWIKTLGDEKVWMIFTNVSPLWDVPKPFHSFDLKASRDSNDDCHAKKWDGARESSVQGYLGDFLALYREPVIDSECNRKELTMFKDIDETRKVCFMNALHKDLRLLNWYNLVDYSYLVTAHEYNKERDDPKLEAYSSLLRIRIGEQYLVLTIGLIDLLKDWDDHTGIKIQQWGGYLTGTFSAVFGQKKFQEYPFYLFCLAVEMIDPYCQDDSRGLQLLSDCGGNNSDIIFPNPESPPNNLTILSMEEYMEQDSYCNLVNSCTAMLQKPKAIYNLGVCAEHACKILPGPKNRCLRGVNSSLSTAPGTRRYKSRRNGWDIKDLFTSLPGMSSPRK